MEEIDKKINIENPVVVTKTFNSFLCEVKKQYKISKQNSTDFKETKELQYIKQKCFSDDPSISLIASNCLVSLVKQKMLQTSSLFPELISAIPKTRCFTGITNTFFELLLIDLENQLKKSRTYSCPFNITSPQHPLITILIQNSSSWRDIYIKLKHVHSIDDRLSVYGYQMFKPLYLFILCNPNETSFSEFQLKLWQFLLNTYKCSSFEFFNDIINWMQTESKNNLYVINDILIESIKLKLNEESYELVNTLIMCLSSNIYHMLVYKLDPFESVSCLLHVFETCDKITTCDFVLMILSEALNKCSFSTLMDLLKLCLVIIERGSINLIILNVIKVCILKWIAHQCELTQEAVNVAKNILHLIGKSESNTLQNKNNSEINYFLKCSNKRVYFAQELCSLAEIFLQNNSALLTWLKKLHKAQPAILTYVFNFVSGIFIMNFNYIISEEALNILQKCVEITKENYGCLQTLILFKLSNTTDSSLHLTLLKALPRTAISKENLPLVLSVLHTFKKGPGNLKTLSIILSYELWRVDNKYYSHLENLLISDYNRECTYNKFQFYIAKAYVIKELCKQRAELYGRELVIHLSKILNECSSHDYALPCALAIDAIAVLCKENVIDIETTWTTLTPKFCEDERIQVIMSLCKFMAQMCVLQYEYYYNLIDKVTEMLWKYSTTNENYEVVESSLKALENFNFDCISVQIQKELNFSNDEHGTKIDLFVDIPDSFWINLLQVNLYPSLWGNFLITLINKEIESYTKGVYNIQENQGEPINYKYLHKNSIVKAIGNYLKEKVDNWDQNSNKEVYLQCLRIFSQEYCKPLPPINWHFLQKLVHNAEARNYSVSIASHQLIVSGSALHFIESFINDVTLSCNNAEDIVILYENLKYLCNSIQPIILEPFIKKSISFAIDSAQNNNDKVLKNILVHLKQTITNDDVQQVNKSVINEIIVDIYEKHTICWNFNEFRKCICSLPPNLLDQISDLKQQKHLSHDVFKSCVKVRCTLALTVVESPLNWISGIIDNIEVKYLKEKDNEYFVLNNIYPVLQKHVDSKDCQVWILELLGKIQALIADSPEEQVQIMFLCKVFMISVIVLSGNNIFITKSIDDFLDEKIYMLLPQSIALLMEQKDWASVCNSQILEWLFHVSNTNVIPTVYKKAFQLSLMALRHTDQFKNSLKWMIYMGGKVSLQ